MKKLGNIWTRPFIGLIQERRQSGEDAGDLLSMLLLAEDEENGGAQMTDKQVRDEALTLLLADMKPPPKL